MTAYATRLSPALLLLCLAGSCGRSGEEEAPKPVVSVETETARREDVPITLDAPATLFPREEANIASRVTVPIRALHVRKGDTVAKGQLLASLEDRDAIAQRADAAASLADAEATLAKTAAGTVPIDVDRAQGQVDTAAAALSQAQKNYDRRNELFKEGAIPNRDLLQAQTDLSQAKTTYEVAVRSLKLLKNGTSQADIASAQARVTSAKAKLDLASAQLQFTEIKAPFSGAVIEQMMYPGDMASSGSPIFTIADLSVWNARTQIPEMKATEVHTGQQCAFGSIDAENAEFHGRITVVNRSIEPAKRTVEVWCEIPGRKGSPLRANLFGNVRILLRTDLSAVNVPLDAVQFNEGTNTGVVMVVDSKMIAHKRDVETGAQAAGRVEIRKGLSGGEQIVTEGGYNLADGTEVRRGAGNKASPVKDDGR